MKFYYYIFCIPYDLFYFTSDRSLKKKRIVELLSSLSRKGPKFLESFEKKIVSKDATFSEMDFDLNLTIINYRDIVDS